MDTPVHKVLEDYDLLNVSVIQNTNTIDMSAGILYRMNLCAASNVIPCTFFVAMNYKVKVYTIDTPYSPFKDPHTILVSPNARQIGVASESPYVINAIKISRLLDKEVLVAVSENGEVCIWRTECLYEPPMILNNEISTWGIAIHADEGLLAVSANNKIITIYNILEMTRENPIFGGSNKNHNWMGKELKIELTGHEHNIPNIDFNHTGQYLASASIDQTCRVWDITTKKVVTQKKTPSVAHEGESDQWCWSAKFIKPGHFKYTVCIDKKINKAFLQRVCQGRSTSFSNLGLHHSAISPVFPTNVSRVLDLGEEDIDFSMYDISEIDSPPWDLSLSQEEEDFMEELYELQRQQEGLGNNIEIPDSHHNNQPSSGTDESHQSEDDFDTSNFRFDAPVALSDTIEDEIQAENESESRFNRGLRDEIIQQQFREMDQGSGQLDSQESVDSEDFIDDLNGDDQDEIYMWTAETTALPTQDDWTRTIVDDNYANRDGWGDEIVPVVQNDPIDDEALSTANLSLCPSSSNNEEITQEEQTNDATDTLNSNMVKSPSNIIRYTSTNHWEDNKKKSKDKQTTLGEYLMISTAKDIMMMNTSKPKMTRIRAEHNIISKVDVRSDQLLSILDRINMVEWLPELELYVAASQKGTVALLRILQVEFEGGKQACIFNNECYLPTGVLQSAPLYGMTVKKIESERFTPISYQIFLFYHCGTVLGYSISRKDCDLMIENFIV